MNSFAGSKSPFTVRGRLLLGADLVPGAIVISEGQIDRIVREPSKEPLPEPVLTAPIVAPGFIDLQVNGGFGVDVGEDPAAFRCLAERLPETGVTAYLPTAISSPAEFYPRLYRTFEMAGQAPGARALGLHLEGPFLSPQRHGAHRREVIEAATPDLLDRLLQPDTDGWPLRLMTLAPERPGALEWIRRLRERKVAISLGHTDASYEEFVRGVDAGATMATHIYNAMSPLHHRAPNTVGAALVDDRVAVGLIADGIHAHPAAVELVIRAKGPDGVVLVTDMISATGMPAGSWTLGGRTVLVDDRSARLQDGTLAGSILTFDQAVRNVVEWTSATVGEVLRMASEIPARVLGLERAGRIRQGSDADLVLLDERLRVQSTLVGGRVVFHGSPDLLRRERHVQVVDT